eukprot:15336115-Ditylum_brightwellii.AAC.1
MRKITTSASYAHNIPELESITVRHLPPVTVLMKDSIWSYDEINTNYADLNTGAWWKRAEAEMGDMLTQRGIEDQRNHYIPPVLFSIDSTHCDQNGRLTSKTILCTAGNISLEKRKQDASWFMLGLLPSKILTPAEREETKKGMSGYGHQVFVHGQGTLNLLFKVAIVIGDTVGHDA